MNIKFEGAKALNDKLKRMANLAPREIERFLGMEAQLVAGRVKMLTPVKTGTLRRAWNTDLHGNTAEIFNNTEYALYVEYGHRVKIHGKFTGKVVQGFHMLRGGIDDSTAQFESDAAQILARVFS